MIDVITNKGIKASIKKGSYILAIVKTNDDYERIRDSLKDLRGEMASLYSITCQVIPFKIEDFLSGD